MIRAAAKNHAHVSVCVDSADYDELLLVLGGNQEGSEAMQHRKRLAWKAYQHCASYDTTVADWLWNQVGQCWLQFPFRFSCIDRLHNIRWQFSHCKQGDIAQGSMLLL